MVHLTKENTMTKLYYTTVSPTFHIYPEDASGGVVQITCANLEQCIETICSHKFYPAKIKDPNNKKEYYINKKKKVKEIKIWASSTTVSAPGS